MGGDNFSAHVCNLGDTMKKRKNNVIPLRPRRRRSQYPRETTNRPYLLRTVVVGCIVGLAFLALVGRLFQMMILQHDKYESEAIRNQTRSISVSANRGKIYDCNMDLLANSVSVETVFIDPEWIAREEEDVDLIAEGLSDILGVDADFVREQAADTEMLYKIIKRKIPEALADEVRQFVLDNHLGGVHLEADSQRSYPCGTLAAQVIGFTNDENQGSEGLEAGYDGLLKGTAGAVVKTRGNGGTEMLYSYEKYYQASNGHDLVLTIDNNVQMFLEKNMQQAIEKYEVQNGAFGIVMDVNTGEIKAMANMGSYDPNDYLEIYDEKTRTELDELYEKALEAKTREEILAAQEKLKAQQATGEKAPAADKDRKEDEAPEEEENEDGEEDGEEEQKEPESYQTLIDQYNQGVMEARLKQWRNRTVSDGYEPGSTFKTITLASALEEGAVSLDDTWFCGGEAKIERRDQILHCWYAQGHGAQTTAQALQNSCNIAFANIGIALGGEKLYEYVKAFGLLEKTGIDLPGEGTGYFFTHDAIANPETYASLTSAAFGQTFKVTPIQLVRAIAAVVNGGYVLEPFVVSEVLDDNGNVIEKQERHVLRQAISEQTSHTMRELMESVVTEGTASNAQVVGYAIGGKTGTSEKIDEFDENGRPVDDKIVSFVGVAPIDDPQYIVLVALDTPSPEAGYYISGGVMAAPVVRDVFTDILPYLGVTPHYEEEDIHYVNMVMPNVTALSRAEAEKNLLSEHLQVEFIGEGAIVTDQIPSSGAEVPGNSTVLVYLGEEKPTDLVTVPDLSGLTQYEARSTINSIDGLYLQTRGSKSDSGSVAVSYQDIPPGTEVERGTTVTVELTDSSAQD